VDAELDALQNDTPDNVNLLWRVSVGSPRIHRRVHWRIGFDRPGSPTLTLWSRSATIIVSRGVASASRAESSTDDRIGIRSHEDPYEKAIGAYQSAADTQASAMAFWNLGWMYENGFGVPQVGLVTLGVASADPLQDWHLAKRFYDLCKQTNTEANLPVTLSLLKLHLRSWWSSFLGGKQEHLAWFAPTTSQRMPDSAGDDSSFQTIDRLEVERDLAQEEDMDVVAWARSRAREETDDTYDDYLETGRIRRSRSQDDGGSFFGGNPDDDDDDIHDTAMIGILVAGLTAAFWFRARQVRQRQEREEAEARARGEPVPPRAAAADPVARPGLDFAPVPI
jgi:SEL1 protein